MPDIERHATRVTEVVRQALIAELRALADDEPDAEEDFLAVADRAQLERRRFSAALVGSGADHSNRDAELVGGVSEWVV